MSVDPEIFAAIMAIFGVGVIGIVETVKRILKLDGAGALIATAVVSFGATAAYLVQTSSFAVVSLIIYGLIVFGEASGLYHVFKRTA